MKKKELYLLVLQNILQSVLPYKYLEKTGQAWPLWTAEAPDAATGRAPTKTRGH